MKYKKLILDQIFYHQSNASWFFKTVLDQCPGARVSSVRIRIPEQNSTSLQHRDRSTNRATFLPKEDIDRSHIQVNVYRYIDGVGILFCACCKPLDAIG